MTRLTPADSRSPSRRGLFFSWLPISAGLALAAILSGGAGAKAEAQIHPPASGVEMPESYREVIARDPRAFQFRRAWIQETARIRRNREGREKRRAEGLSDLSADIGLQTVVSGTKQVPVLMGKYSNTPVDPITRASLQQELFDGPWPTGTMTDFYHEISYNNLTMTGTVYDWVQVSGTDTYYEGSAGCNGLSTSCGGKTGEFIKSVLDLNDGAVDFSQYDNDGPDGLPDSGDDDGYVDFVAFVQPEKGGECGTSNIWSHRWVYEGWWGASYTTNDPRTGGGFIQVSDYTVQPALGCGGGQIEIGVFCHEFGHAFGLPDLYDTDGTSNGIGAWCLMASGSYGGDNAHPATPTHMSAWCKEQLGWVTPTVLCGDETSWSFPQVETNATVLKIYPHGVPDTEYFLIENRQKVGYDTYLRTGGLAVWHIDNDQGDNANEAHKMVDLEEADGLNHLDLKTNRADAGDLFPGSMSKFDFDDTTNPNSKDYNVAFTGFGLNNISASSAMMSANVTLDDCRMLAWDYAVLDTSECGNGNALLDAGETALLRMTAWNIGDDHTGVTGTLSSLSAELTVESAVASYGSVLSGQKKAADAHYRLRLDPGTPDGTVVQLQMDFSADGGAFNVTDTFSLTVGRTILLVDDDEGATRETLYTTPITASGYPVRTWSIQTSGSPRPGALNTSRAVVWLTSQAYDNTLTPTDQEIITGYLAAGGRIFVTGQDIGYDLEAQGSPADITFYHNVLKAAYVLDDTNDNTMTGVGGDPIGNGLSFSINGGDGANNNDYPSRISTTGGSSAVFQYAANSYGGVRHAGTGRMVYAAFCFEGISTQANRDLVMDRILDWLLPTDQAPPLATLTAPNGPSGFPACSNVDITWSATDNVGVTGIDLYYSSDCGATYPHIIATGLANSGSYSWAPPAMEGPGYRVLLVARDAVGLRRCDVSDSCFTVSDTTPPVVAFVTPAAGAIWTIGQSRDIEWTASDDCSTIDSLVVSISHNGGANWQVLGADEANDGTFTWDPVSGPPTVTALVRVQAFTGSLEGGAISDAFSIQDGIAPVVTVVSPNGGESYAAGSSQDILFTVMDATGIDSTCVEFSSDNGANWAPVECTTNDSLLAWSVPGVSSDSCLIRVTSWDLDGNSGFDTSDGLFEIVGTSSVANTAGLTRPTLFQNAPNPFTPRTTISFFLPAPASAELSIFDLQGRRIRTLVSGSRPAGYQEFVWDGRDESGAEAASGMFFYVLEAGSIRDIRKMVLMK
jgi:M6 family metalloprotease-like protein